MKTRSNFTMWSLAAICLMAAMLMGFGLYPGLSSRSKSGAALLKTESMSEAASSKFQELKGGEGRTRNSNRMTKEDAAAKAKAMAVRLIPLAAKSASGERPGPDDLAEIMAQLEDISHFNTHQMKILIGEISRSPDLDANGKAESCGFFLEMMARIDPVAALDLLSELQPLLKGQKIAVSVITLMETVADSQAPLAAEWLLQNTHLFENPMQLEAAKGRLLKGAAKDDPALAFTLMDQLKVTSPAQAMADIVRAAHTNEERLGLITAMRKKTGAMDDPAASEEFKSGMLSAMGAAMVRDSSTKTEAFIQSARLDEGEQAILLDARGK